MKVPAKCHKRLKGLDKITRFHTSSSGRVPVRRFQQRVSHRIIEVQGEDEGSKRLQTKVPVQVRRFQVESSK